MVFILHLWKEFQIAMLQEDCVIIFHFKVDASHRAIAYHCGVDSFSITAPWHALFLLLKNRSKVKLLKLAVYLL